jgi:phage tail protein X
VPNVVIPVGGVGVIQPGLVSEYVNPAQPESGIIYPSVGERWDSIAFRMYGDPTQLGNLVLNNPGIAVTDLVAAGVQVFVPLITPAVPATTSTPWG